MRNGCITDKMNPVNIIYIVLYLNSIQPSHVKHTIKTVYLLHIITLFILRCPSIRRYEIM